MIVQDIEQRGLRLGLHALAPRERDVFVVYDLHLYYQTEGCFADHIPNAPEKFDWLEDTLQRIGDLESLRVIKQLRVLDADDMSRAIELCDQYEERNEHRWACLGRYLTSQGVQLEWDDEDA